MGFQALRDDGRGLGREHVGSRLASVEIEVDREEEAREWATKMS
jgi:hypothetical protein